MREHGLEQLSPFAAHPMLSAGPGQNLVCNDAKLSNELPSLSVFTLVQLDWQRIAEWAYSITFATNINFYLSRDIDPSPITTRDKYVG